MNGNGEMKDSEITIYGYFKSHKKISLHHSTDMPCINDGKPKQPCYFPIEVLKQISTYLKIEFNRYYFTLLNQLEIISL